MSGGAATESGSVKRNGQASFMFGEFATAVRGNAMLVRQFIPKT